MKPDSRFVNLPLEFWANIRSISERLGYTARGTGQILVPGMDEIVARLRDLDLGSSHLVELHGDPTEFGMSLVSYFRYRADVLNQIVEPKLMTAKEAEEAFRSVSKESRSQLPIVMNKQKGKKKKPAYLTNMVNMLIHDNSKGHPFDRDPRKLTTFTKDGSPLRTLARRVDGAFPSTTNPIAIWEIKEYYHTTTFGSRVADGVYETLLDGMELKELKESEGVDCKHYLFIDAHYTWWDCGRSYLCRIIDMLHMGYVDEVLFGKEILDRLPKIVKGWVASVPGKPG